MLLIVFQVLQIITALALIILTAVTTTKSEAGAGMGGWGTIGGKSSSSIAGLEDQLGRITMYAAVVFLMVSLLVAAVAIRS